MNDLNRRIEQAWGTYLEKKVAEGWIPYLMTFKFEPLSGGRAARMAQMTRYLEAAYGIFATRVVRRPHARSSKGRLPIWLCWPDLPVCKRAKKDKASLLDVIPNDGLHYHATLLLPPWTRILDVQMHFEDLRGLYLRRALLDRVDVAPIVDRVGYVNGYGRKSISKGLFDVGDGFVLPRALKELPA